MSRSRNIKRRPKPEYWSSRLHRYGESPGRRTKTMTHRLERRRPVGDDDGCNGGGFGAKR